METIEMHFLMNLCSSHFIPRFCAIVVGKPTAPTTMAARCVSVFWFTQRKPGAAQFEPAIHRPPTKPNTQHNNFTLLQQQRDH